MTSPTPSRFTVAPIGPATWNSSLYWPVSRSSLRSCCVRVSKFALGMLKNPLPRPLPEYRERKLVLRHLEHDLDRVARLHELETALEVFQRQLVRDDRIQLQPAGQHEVLDLKPRLVHQAAVDAQHRGALEDDVVVEVELDGLRRKAEHRDRAAVAQRGEALADRSSAAAHFEKDFRTLTLGGG